MKDNLKNISKENFDINGNRIDFDNKKKLNKEDFDDYMNECGYKDSKTEWIGYIPKTSKVKLFKNTYLHTNSGEVIPKEYWKKEGFNLYTCSKNKLKTNFNKFPKSKLTKKGDLLITKNATPYIVIPNENSLYNKKVQRIKLKKNFNYNYIKYMLDISKNYLMNYGDIIPSLNLDKWNELYVLEPSYQEQLAIANFLDNKTNSIDKKISILERRNKLLIELEKSIINQAVTKGIDSFSKLDKQGNKIDFENKLNKNDINFEKYMNECGYKDSGIKWIGYVNDKWKIKRLKNTFYNLSIGIKNFNKEKIYLSTKSIGINKIVSNEGKITFTKRPSRANMQPIINSVWFAKMKNTNKIYSFKDKIECNKYILSTGFCGLLIKKNHLKFVNYYIQSNYFIFEKDMYSYGTTQFSINDTNIEKINFICPPKHEQIQIAKFLDNKTNQLKTQKDSIKKEISLLKEYKQSLINDVVTGKIRIIEN